jgi:hypothetical protein
VFESIPVLEFWYILIKTRLSNIASQLGYSQRSRGFGRLDCNCRNWFLTTSMLPAAMTVSEKQPSANTDF